MSDYDKLEERRQMARSNYYAQMAMMGYDSGGNALDLVEVVRCKNCMYWKSNTVTYFWKPCDVVSTDKDWYCPCGKRR